MKIPESIRIGGVEYRVVYEPNARAGNNLVFGKIDFDNSQIVISETDGTGHEHRCMTMLHEVLHGIIWHASAEFENEERIVEVMAKGLYQVLQDNGGRLFDLRKPEPVHDCSGSVACDSQR